MANSSFRLLKSSRRIGALTVWLLLAFALPAQVYTYKLTSVPDSAEVVLNGEIIGKTPFDAKIDWSKAKSGGIELVFMHAGYKDTAFVIAEKPRYKENFKDMKMAKSHPHFDLGPDAVLVKFDKVMTEFPMGKIIGRNKTFYGGDITWEAYSRVGNWPFETKANDILGTAGFRTPFIQKNELFSEEIAVDTVPRFLLGGKVTDIWVGLGPTTLIGIEAKNWCTIEWKVFDKALGKVVLTQVSRGEFVGKYTNPTELRVMMDLFEDSLDNFIATGSFAELVKKAKREQ